jgi:hypothetical protein
MLAAGFLAMKEAANPSRPLRRKFDPHLLAARAFVLRRVPPVRTSRILCASRGVAPQCLQLTWVGSLRNSVCAASLRDISALQEGGRALGLIFKIVESAALSPSVHDRTRCQQAGAGVAAATGA